MENCSNELKAKFSKPKISNKPILNRWPSRDYRLISFTDFRTLFPLKSS